MARAFGNIALGLLLLLIWFEDKCLCSNFQIKTFNSVNRSFTIDPKTHTFLKDGVPFQYISGSFHYFRIPKIYWRDRLEKAKAAGLDAIQIYIPWNFHEPEEGNYDFSNERDFEYFIDLIRQLDMLAIVRAGPYICAEWAFGGLPAWLLRKNPSMKIRSSDPSYFNEVVTWFNVLLPKLKRNLYSVGGPIIMVQLENEYGSFDICDADYMRGLYDLARQILGPDVILFTTDGAGMGYLRCGALDPRYLTTIDFGPTSSTPEDSFKVLEDFRPGQPWINSEFYTGWFDGWGTKHSRSKASFVTESLMRLMKYSQRVNVNMYMFHGGTNFGLWNGKPDKIPAITSYDYDAPISEAGDMTYKYELIRKAISEFRGISFPLQPKNITRKSYGTVTLEMTSHLLNPHGPVKMAYNVVNMESLGQYEGFTFYSTRLPGRLSIPELILKKFADRAFIFTVGIKRVVCQAILTWPNNKLQLNLQDGDSHLVVIVENTGYVNFGSGMHHNLKGLLDDVVLDNQLLHNWTIIPLKTFLKFDRIYPPQIIEKLPINGAIFTGELLIKGNDTPADTFMQAEGFTEGIIAINSQIIGRFNQQLGPQLRLYVPKQYLHTGRNRITICELQGIKQTRPTVTFHEEMKWSDSIELNDYRYIKAPRSNDLF